jgi:hypothetical protein
VAKRISAARLAGGCLEIADKTISFQMHHEDLSPPGTYYSIVSQPHGKRPDAMEVAVMHEHRFAFFFWARWTQRRSSAPDLISLDWHQDLALPDAEEKRLLEALPLQQETVVSIASWAELHQQNDGHILAAAYLGLLGDIYVVQKQRDEVTPLFQDRHGHEHHVFCFQTEEELLDVVNRRNVEDVYFDIDLDFFTESKEPSGGGENVTLVTRDEVRRLLDPAGRLMAFVFPRLRGMTLALEPEFCGGLRNAHRLFEWVDTTLFDPGLLAKTCGWRHRKGRA